MHSPAVVAPVAVVTRPVECPCADVGGGVPRLDRGPASFAEHDSGDGHHDLIYRGGFRQGVLGGTVGVEMRSPKSSAVVRWRVARLAFRPGKLISIPLHEESGGWGFRGE